MNRLPVVDSEGRVMGLLTRTDVLAALAHGTGGVFSSHSTVILGVQ